MHEIETHAKIAIECLGMLFKGSVQSVAMCLFPNALAQLVP